MKKEENARFEVIYKEGNGFKTNGVFQVVVDKETGVNYLLWKCGYGTAITPLLDSEGKPVNSSNGFNF